MLDKLLVVDMVEEKYIVRKMVYYMLDMQVLDLVVDQD
jgi:hypothetical protein